MREAHLIVELRKQIAARDKTIAELEKRLAALESSIQTRRPASLRYEDDRSEGMP